MDLYLSLSKKSYCLQVHMLTSEVLYIHNTIHQARSRGKITWVLPQLTFSTYEICMVEHPEIKILATRLIILYIILRT